MGFPNHDTYNFRSECTVAKACTQRNQLVQSGLCKATMFVAPDGGVVTQSLVVAGGLG